MRRSSGGGGGGSSNTAPSIDSVPITDAVEGIPYAYAITASGTPDPTITATGLPGWLTLVGDVLTGTPGAADMGMTGLIIVTASNGVAPDAVQFFLITVLDSASAAAPTITSTAPTSATVGEAYAYSITATGTPTPTIDVTGLPAWLSLSAGAISGTPLAGDVGPTGTITVTASNGVPPDATQSFTITVFDSGGGPAWTIEVVDSGETSTGYTSIAVESNGTPNISYIDRANERYKYATWDGAQWVTRLISTSRGPFANAGKWSSIAVDSAGIPHVSFHVADVAYKYAYWDAAGSTWVITDVPHAVTAKAYLGHNAIAVSPLDDSIHIAAWLTNNNPLPPDILAYWTPGMGSALAIDGPPVASDGTFNNTGHQCDIVVDGTGGIHISYFSSDGQPDYGTQYLAYAHWDGFSWSTEYIEAPGGTSSFSHHTAIAVDSSNRPHIAYYSWAAGAYKYAYYNGSSWDIETIANFNSVGWSAQDIALDSTDIPHVVYYGVGNRLKYARRTGGAWQTEAVKTDTDLGGGFGCSIAIDGSDIVHVSYYDASIGALKYARRSP